MLHAIALVLGLIIDFMIGDPKWLYHPVCFIGNLIGFLERRIRALFPKSEKGELAGGLVLVLIVCLICFFVPYIIISFLYSHLWWTGLLLETFWCYQLLAARSLKDESMKVYDALTEGSIEEARFAVSMIVGRDTESLDSEGVTKATVETVAESTSDGIIAPAFYMIIGGVPLMFLYKAINTMDSMLGYKNEKYLYFGRCAARLDDLANFIPARLAGCFMVLTSSVVGFDMANAAKIFKRDRLRHASPNSAHTESAMAGALCIQLAGNAYYFGKLYEKPTIGDRIREICPEDIINANKLAYATAILGVYVFAAARLIIGLL